MDGEWIFFYDFLPECWQVPAYVVTEVLVAVVIVFVFETIVSWRKNRG